MIHVTRSKTKPAQNGRLMEQRTKFSGWISNYGVGKLAQAMGCTRFAVYKWERGESIPRTDRLLVMTRLAGGALSLDDVLEHFASSRSHR